MESLKKRSRRIKTERAMEKLISEMKLEIFSRLPIESVFRCRCVCKSWHSLLNDPHFINMHTQQRLLSHSSSSTVSFIINVRYEVTDGRTSRNGYTVHFGDYDDDLCTYKESKSNLMNLLYVLRMKHANVIGSCNGLVCLRTGTKDKDGDHNIVYNPVTKEAVNIPSDKSLRDDEEINKTRINVGSRYNPKEEYRVISQRRITIGFGYHPSTKEYKIVSGRTRTYWVKPAAGDRSTNIECSDDNNCSTNIEDVRVYTLGSGKWRNIDQDDVAAAVSYDFGSDHLGVHVNGSLYWITNGSSLRHGMEQKKKKKMIMSFDLGAEKFGCITALPTLPPRPSSLRNIDDRITPVYKLEESRGCLFLIFFYRPFDRTLYNHSFVYSEIWVMKKEKKHDGNRCNNTYTWSKVLERTGDHGRGMLTRFVALTKSGKVLFRHECNQMLLSCFDPNTGSTACLREISSRSPLLPHVVEVFPHMKSFVSIKALGEENAGIIEGFENAEIMESFVSLETLREKENAEIRKTENKICFF